MNGHGIDQKQLNVAYICCATLVSAGWLHKGRDATQCLNFHSASLLQYTNCNHSSSMYGWAKLFEGRAGFALLYKLDGRLQRYCRLAESKYKSLKLGECCVPSLGYTVTVISLNGTLSTIRTLAPSLYLGSHISLTLDLSNTDRIHWEINE